MTNTRALIARFALPLAATALVLSACGSSTASDVAEAAGTTSAAAEVMESETSEAMESKESEAMEEESDDMASMSAAPPEAAAGAYITLAQYEGSKDMYAQGDVVLFFAADWCPTCQEATANLESDPAAIPAGLAIVRVDYDNSDELKQKYGVTVQHTFVQVDVDGNEIAKWSGSVTADEIAKQTA